MVKVSIFLFKIISFEVGDWYGEKLLLDNDQKEEKALLGPLMELMEQQDIAFEFNHDWNNSSNLVAMRKACNFFIHSRYSWSKQCLLEGKHTQPKG